MTYRLHQIRMVALCKDILSGAPIKKIIASVTPGGGKSKLPVILADKLIPSFADKLVWVAPRNNLKYQGEQEFLDTRFPTSRRLRAADGNENGPCRGTDGYLTTYQAVGLSPEVHAQFCREHRTILFLDEEHHVSDDGLWAHAIQAMCEAAVLVVLASGTFARGDGAPIAWMNYLPNGQPDLANEGDQAVIEYTRSTALREGAIVPVSFSYLDGRSEWEEDGERHEAESFGGDYVAQAIFTALRTDYAFGLLDECIAHWRDHRAHVYQAGKLLVVAPTIELAEKYQAHLHRRNIDALIATSDDTPAAIHSISRFKGQALPSTDALVTVGMAYEGLSVPAVSHIACLTHIRSIPWLEQCFARANRTAPGKVGGFVFGPDDPRFRAAIESIEAEQVHALEDRSEAGEGSREAGEEGQEGTGSSRPWITPIGSMAYRAADAEFCMEEARPDGGLPPSQAEKLLRKQIARHIEVFLSDKRPGSRASYSTIIHRRLKALVGGKAREDCTVEELTAQWAYLKETWPV